jgi:hypothetical protein
MAITESDRIPRALYCAPRLRNECFRRRAETNRLRCGQRNGDIELILESGTNRAFASWRTLVEKCWIGRQRNEVVGQPAVNAGADEAACIGGLGRPVVSMGAARAARRLIATTPDVDAVFVRPNGDGRASGARRRRPARPRRHRRGRLRRLTAGLDVHAGPDIKEGSGYQTAGYCREHVC